MPRLKALVTGKAPAFIDILKNFNSAALAEENLISLLAESERRIVFYGDDTWLKLFPSIFQRSDGTSGFFTRDTVEVDTNVTRHLQDELDPTLRSDKSVDWDVLVLHYLGLDHVGHLRGPRSAMMADKLHEMDAIVERVHESVKAQDAVRKEHNPSALPSLILLCSDHGMSEVGNHGGATVEESSALMMFLRGDGRKMRTTQAYSQRRKQVDLVPTIASLFGLRIPPYSTGLLLDEVVQASTSSGHHEGMETDVRQPYLQSLYRNFQQLYQLAMIKFHASSLVEFDATYGAAIEKLRASLERTPGLQGVADDNDDTELARGVLIREACGVLQDKLAESDGSEYNGHMALAGLCFLFGSAGVALRMMLFQSKYTSYRHQQHSDDWRRDPVTLMFIGGSVLQVISLTSSSSIENEHATAFYLLTTVLFAFGLNMVASSTLRRNGSRRADEFLLVVVLLCTRMLRSRNQVINFGRLNGISVDLQTPGNEFAADDSLSIHSTGPLFSGVVPAEACFVLICGLVTWKALRLCTKKTVTSHPVALLGFSLSSLSFAVGMLCSLLCCRMARLESDPQEPQASKLTLLVLAEHYSADDYARAVYAVVAFLVLLLIVNHLARLLVAEMAVWLLVTLLQRESNLPTLACLCVQLFCLRSLLSTRPRPSQQVSLVKNGVALGLLALWLAQSAFFALGNSHLVTTIDLSQSYHGLSGYTQWIVGLLTTVSVFSGPLVVFVNLLQWVQSVAMSPSAPAPVSAELFENEGDSHGSMSISGAVPTKASSTVTDVCLALFVYQILRFAVYTYVFALHFASAAADSLNLGSCSLVYADSILIGVFGSLGCGWRSIVVYLMRFHLFIWSVFAPKVPARSFMSTGCV